ncbi:MAG: NFACT family protein [Candidatus Gastranaerophilaceae bacterium]
MTNFDFKILNLFIEENMDFLQGGRLQKIQQPTRQEFVFSLRNKGETKKLYINIHPKFFHLCFMSGENEKKRLIEIPKSPPMFCMLLRKYLESAKIAKVCQPQNGEILERILEFYFETYNGLSEKIYLCLAIELMGKHSNVVLYNYDTNIITGCAHNVGAEKSSVREIIGGLPYAYPPKHDNQKFLGLSSLLKSGNSANETIDNYFAPLQEAEKIRAIKSKLTSAVNAKLKKINNSLGKVQKQLKTSSEADLYRKKGDLIMADANVCSNKTFSDEIEILDWETSLPMKIQLDKTKTLKENANEYYKLYKKAKMAKLKSQEMSEALKLEKDYLEQVLYSIESAEFIGDLLDIEEEAKGDKRTGNRKQGTGKRKWEMGNGKWTSQPFSLSTQKQFTVFVGKNNKQNDYIVSKLARDGDLWFHVHNCAGSHVLLRVDAGQEADEEVIFECANLAKEYSSAKNSSKVGVIYTKAKNLKKPPGANLGYVTYKGEKEIIVD